MRHGPTALKQNARVFPAGAFRHIAITTFLRGLSTLVFRHKLYAICGDWVDRDGALFPPAYRAVPVCAHRPDPRQ